MSISWASAVGVPWVADSRPPSGAITSTRTKGTLKVDASAPVSAGSCSSTDPAPSSRAAKPDTTS